MSETEKSVFEVLSAINVNDKVEKKNGLTYLSWAWAWAEVKKNYPSATYKVVKDEATNMPFVFDPNMGYMCSTEVTIKGETLEMWLPVMDGANKAMKLEAYEYTTKYGNKSVQGASMFDINKTIMRCLVKNLAMFGLGHYIYAGEDLPQDDKSVAEKLATPKKAEPKKPIKIKLDIGDDNWTKVLRYVAANKELGLKKIGENLTTKYSMSAVVKKEIKKAIG
tara:strand:- start:4601 stop:5266 length:666 start_codon:yes stop_codon:yes gene_type:complete